MNFEKQPPLFSAEEIPDLESGVRKISTDVLAYETVHPDSQSLILIAGPTGSGKTHLAKEISQNLSDCTTISLDRYYLNKDSPNIPRRNDNTINWSEPNALDIERINTDIDKIMAAKPGEEVSVPVFEMSISQRTGEKNITIGKRIIIEGIYPLNLIKFPTDFRVYIDADLDRLLERKLQRDVTERGISPSVVKDRFENNVKPAILNYVQPQKQQARYIIHNEFEKTY